MGKHNNVEIKFVNFGNNSSEEQNKITLFLFDLSINQKEDKRNDLIDSFTRNRNISFDFAPKKITVTKIH